MNICSVLLSRTLSPFEHAYPADVDNVMAALARLGGDLPDTPRAPSLIDRIEAFQRSGDVRVDGIMRPGGVTERLLNTALWEHDMPGEQKARRVLPLGATVGYQGDNAAPDVRRVEDALRGAGYLDGTINDLVYRGDEKSRRYLRRKQR